MDQDDRERILVRFRNGSLNYLVTTDLAARGLDIAEMNHVIHYHLPAKESEFVHRNGRTARMHASGTAYIVQFKDDKMPDYISDNLDILPVATGKPLPNRPEYQTIYVSGGKKNKLNKSDIVGFFLQKGKLDKSDLGLIEVNDFISFVAVRASLVKTLLTNIRDEKMKGKKYKIEVSRNVALHQFKSDAVYLLRLFLPLNAFKSGVRTPLSGFSLFSSEQASLFQGPHNLHKSGKRFLTRIYPVPGSHLQPDC